MEEYENWYYSQPWWWRIKNRIHWRLLTIWCALIGRVTPMERLMMEAWKRQKDRA